MRLSTTTKIILGVLALAALAVAYYGISPLFRNIEVQDEVPTLSDEDIARDVSLDMEEPEATNEEAAVEPVVTGPFPVMGTVGHPAQGSVRVFHTESETVIRYEDFETINGPNLHVYLSKDIEGKEFIDLGPIKGTQGNINYTIPEGVDLSTYKYILTWCVPFGVLFNYAQVN